MVHCKSVHKIRKNLIGCIKVLIASLECIHEGGKRSICVTLCSSLLLFVHHLNHSHCLSSSYISVQSFCLLLGIYPGFCNVFTATVMRSARGPRSTDCVLIPTSSYLSWMPLQWYPSCQGYRQGIEREINAGNKINEVGRAQDYGMDGRADSGMARPGFQWAAVSW
jgi:hypothetical protein